MPCFSYTIILLARSVEEIDAREISLSNIAITVVEKAKVPYLTFPRISPV